MTGVPYKSISNAIQDFYGNQIQVIFMEYLPAIAQIQGGKVNALAVTEAHRYNAWPNVPTIAETYPGYNLGFFLGLGAPAGISKEVNSYLENVMADANKMTSLPGVFTAGDMTRGQSLVVWAIYEGRTAAQGVHRYLYSKH